MTVALPAAETTRVGDWRVRFDRDPEESVVVIQRVLPRGRADRD